MYFQHEVRFLSSIHFEVDFEFIIWNTYSNNKTSSYQQKFSTKLQKIFDIV